MKGKEWRALEKKYFGRFIFLHNIIQNSPNFKKFKICIDGLEDFGKLFKFNIYFYNISNIIYFNHTLLILRNIL